MSTLVEIEQAAAKLTPVELRELTQFLLRRLEPSQQRPSGPARDSGGKAPDFLARAKAVWGECPAGKPLSAVVSEGRGGAA